MLFFFCYCCLDTDFVIKQQLLDTDFCQTFSIFATENIK